MLPLAIPAVVAGSIFTFSLTLGDFIAPQIVMAGKQLIGNVVYANVGVANNLPFAAAFATVPVAVMIVYCCWRSARERSTASDGTGRLPKILLRLATGVALAFIYVPLLIVGLYAFNESRIQAWPIQGVTFKWFEKALHNHGAQDALILSLKAATGATLVALVLGTLAALAVARHRFFGRETVSFLVILPIALPGIVTGMALNATFRTVLEPLGISFGLFTVIVGHATFCIVVVYNNVVARLGGCPARWKRRRWISARTSGRPSGS